MLSQGYVRPPLSASEAAPQWVARWRFRLVMLILVAVLALIGVILFRQLSGANAQDPGIGARAAGVQLVAAPAATAQA